MKYNKEADLWFPYIHTYFMYLADIKFVRLHYIAFSMLSFITVKLHKGKLY